MQKKYDVIAAGHICLDISPKFVGDSGKTAADIFIPGRLINMDGVDFSPGGPVANTGFAINKLGLSVLPMAGVGNDAFGGILSNMVEEEMGLTIAKSDALATSYSVVLSPPHIDRIILHDPAGNNAFSAQNVDFKALKNARLFHFGYPPLMRNMYADGGKALFTILKKAKATEITTSLDMSLPDTETESGQVDWATLLTGALPYVDIFLPSVEEAFFMLDRDEYDRIKRTAKGDDFTKHLDMQKVAALGTQMLAMGCAVVIIKCGANGIYFRSATAARLQRMGRGTPANMAAWADKALFRETYVVKNFKSALAGGDTTIAGFLSAMLRGYSLVDSLKIACKTGALCCTTYDSISGLLPLDETYKKTQTEAKRNVYPLKAEGFTFDESDEVWVQA